MISSFGYDLTQFSNDQKVSGRAGLLGFVYIDMVYVQKRSLGSSQPSGYRETAGKDGCMEGCLYIRAYFWVVGSFRWN